jgi:hypothetical protein
LGAICHAARAGDKMVTGDEIVARDETVARGTIVARDEDAARGTIVARDETVPAARSWPGKRSSGGRIVGRGNRAGVPGVLVGR